MSRKAVNQVKATVNNLLLDHEEINAQKAEELAELLSTGTWTHDYPITVQEAREIGLPISTEMPSEVYQLMDLYKSTSKGRPSVAYIPSPYQKSEKN
jgi:ClpP class serine protease